ncbi:MFS transporter [Arthrobacter sp.]|uniref:MFS transporter n=1 Tax=Arthrobacter sp. TaxID=1667 RepID=UPI003A8FED73
MPSHQPPSPPTTPLRRDLNFLVFWLGQTLSQFGAQLGAVAMPVLAVSLLQATEWEVGVLNAANTVAFLVVGLPVGAWVDRFIKRRIMIRADLVRMLAMLVIPLLWYQDLLQIWHLWIIAAVIGIANVFFDVSYQSYIPALVEREQISEANAKLETTGQVSRLAGPALGGGLLVVLAAPLLFIGQAIGYLVSALCLTRVRDDEIPATRVAGTGLVAEIREGMAYVVRHPLIGPIAATTGTINFFSTIIFTLLPILALRTLSLNTVELGLVYSAGAVGGLIAASLTPWVSGKMGEGPSLVLGTLLTAGGMAGFPLSILAGGLRPSFAILAASMFVMTVGVLIYNIIQVSMRQTICPPRLLGRMNASIRFIVWGVMPVASLLAGFLGTALGISAALWIGVAGSLAGVLPLLLSPVARMRSLPSTQEHDGGAT